MLLASISYSWATASAIWTRWRQLSGFMPVSSCPGGRLPARAPSHLRPPGGVKLSFCKVRDWKSDLREGFPLGQDVIMRKRCLEDTGREEQGAPPSGVWGLSWGKRRGSSGQTERFKILWLMDLVNWEWRGRKVSKAKEIWKKLHIKMQTDKVAHRPRSEHWSHPHAHSYGY